MFFCKNEIAKVHISGIIHPQTTQERKAERMLMLELTDGSTVVEGMEYRAAPNLSVNLSPGTKVRLFLMV